MAYQDKNLKYINAEAYDKRGENSILENYVLGFWKPFQKFLPLGVNVYYLFEKR